MAWKSFKMNGTRWAIERKHFLEYLLRKKCKQVCNLLCSVRSGDQVLSICLILPYLVRLLQWLSCEEFACNEGDAGSIPGWGRSPRGHGNPLRYACRENPTDRGAWWVTVQRVPQSQTRLKQQQQKHYSVWLSYRDLNLDLTFWVILSIAPHWNKNW